MRIKDHVEFSDIKIIDNFYSMDNRGGFTKIFNKDIYEMLGINMEISESFYSMSHRDVIRGMHFQLPPYAHGKLVHVIRGSVWDVIVDLRKNSSNYKKSICIELSDKKAESIYIPKGFAHGFKCLENNTIMLYNVTEGYNKDCDSGIKWNSINFDWNVQFPIVSERDNSFVELKDFDSMF